MELTKCKLGELITQRREKSDGSELPICGVSKDGLIPPKQIDADTSLYNVFYRDDFIFNPARMELNSIAINDRYDRAICSSLYEVFYVHRTDLLLPHYLKLIVKRNWFTRYCEFLGQGSAREYCRFNNISEIEIEFPPINEQRRIAQYYDSIQKRISLKHRINDNLAKTIKAIFKSWFLDFNALKGVEFVQSQYGLIPEKWHYELLGDLCECVTKGTTPTTLGRNFTDSGINFIKGESINNDHSFNKAMFAYIDEETDKLLRRSRILENDIVFTIAGTLGKFALVDSSVVPANTNQAVAIIRTSKISPEMLYSYFIGEWQVEFYKKNTQQAVQANLSLTTIKDLPILLPDNDSQQRFMRLVEPFIETMRTNFAEVERLSELQSQLLTGLSLSR